MTDDPHDSLTPPIYGARGEEWQAEPDQPVCLWPRVAGGIIGLTVFVGLLWWWWG